MEMYLGKVTREYADQEQERMKREARQQSRLRSAFYSTTGTSPANHDIIDEAIDRHTESEDECEESLLTSPEPTSVNFIIIRKNQKRFSFRNRAKGPHYISDRICSHRYATAN